MKCLHCGYCCIMYDVIIISPEYATDDLNVKAPKDGDKVFMHKPTGVACPHLTKENDEYRCAIHHYAWYKDTPCFDFGQIEDSIDAVCRMGDYVLNKKPPMKAHLLEIFNKPVPEGVIVNV